MHTHKEHFYVDVWQLLRMKFEVVKVAENLWLIWRGRHYTATWIVEYYTLFCVKAMGHIDKLTSKLVAVNGKMVLRSIQLTGD